MSRLRQIRTERGISQEALAKMAKVSRRTVINAEKGNELTIHTMRRIAKALNMRVSDLFPLDESA